MKTFGKISLGLGLLLLLSSPLTLMVTSASPLYASVKAALGVALLAFWWFAGRSPQSAPVEGMGAAARSGFFYGSSAIFVVIAIGALGLVNFIVAKRAKTYDWTRNKIYSLSPQTSSVVKGLAQPVKAIGFLDSSHPAWSQLDDLFKRYAAEGDKFTFEFKDPRKNPDLAAKYQLKEGQATVVLTRGSGADEAHTSLATISENELTNALVKIDSTGTQKIYFVVGHGEWTLARGQPAPGEDGSATSMAELKTSLLQEGYAADELNLAEKQNVIPRDAAALVIANARAKYTEPELQAVEAYLAQGGRLVYFAEPGAEPGLDGVLAKYGLQVDPGLLADDKVNPQSPYVIVTPFFADHEVTRMLKQLRMQVQLPTARGLAILKQGTLDGVTTTPIVLTSPYAWVETTPNDSPTRDSGEKSGAIPVAAVSTRPTKDVADKRYDEARVVVLGDSQIVVDALWGYEPNRNLVMNAVAWATSQVSKITIRPPDRELSMIDINDAMLGQIRFVSMDLLPVLLLGIGLAIWGTRRSK